MLVEFLIQPYGVVGIHYYLIDNKESKAVLLRLINSHYPEHKEINPKTKEDGYKLFCNVFAQDLHTLKNMQ